VGVVRQYCGARGKTANCQVAVSVSLVNKTMSVPAAWRLYLPEIWAGDPERRRKAGVPQEVGHQEEWRIALEEIDRLLQEDLPPAPVVADAGYGSATEFRDELTRRGLSYAAGIREDTGVWPPGQEPLPEKPYSGQGRPPTSMRRDKDHQPVSARVLAEGLPKVAWNTVRWREGTKGTMLSRFAAVRVRPSHRDYLRREARPVEWLLIEWPPREPKPTKYWLSTVPEEVELSEPVSLAKIRWRIERDFQELKDELGLDHYEGRGWRGFHHHGVLCIAAYCFLAAERGRLSPLSLLPSSSPLKFPEVSLRAALPVRAERHNPSSITTQRLVHARALLQRLPCCPACGANGTRHYDTVVLGPR